MHKNNHELLEIDLQLFNEGGGAAAAPAGDGGDAGDQGAPKAETSGSSRRNRTGEDVVYGLQDQDAADMGEGAANKSGVSTTSNTLEDKRAAFKAMVEGEYKDQFTEMFQNTFNRRFKEVKGMEASLSAQKPILDMLAQRYGTGDDMAALQKAIESDTEYWEAAAEAEGLTVEQYQAMQRLERENEALRREESRRLGESQAQQQVQKWVGEAETLKDIYPSFDLQTELSNDQFKGLLRSGIPVQQAYELVHMDEIKEAAARNAAQAVGAQMEARIKSRASRPVENGVSSQSASIVKSNVHNLTRADRAEIAKRVGRGARIRF